MHESTAKNHPFVKELANLLMTHTSLPQDVKKTAYEMIRCAGVTGYIYHIICTANSRGYVGQTTDLIQRMRNHIQEIGGTGSNKTILWNLNFAKHGISHYKVEILESNVPGTLLLDRERYWQEVKRAILSCEETYRTINAEFRGKDPSWRTPRFWEDGSSQWEGASINEILSDCQKQFIAEVVQRYGHIDRPCESDGIPLEKFIKKRVSYSWNPLA